jgi:hypothetical protein
MRWGAMQFFNDAREVDQLFPQQHFFRPLLFQKYLFRGRLRFVVGNRSLLVCRTSSLWKTWALQAICKDSAKPADGTFSIY